MADMVTPTKKTSEQELSEINATLRSNPAYQEFLRSMGIDPAGPIKLTDQQREQAKAFLRSQGVPLEGGMEIDPAGNINQNEGVGKWAKDWRTYAAIGAGIAGLGVAGIGPLAGVMGGGSAAGGSGAVNAAGVFTNPAYAGAMAPFAPAGMAAGAATGTAAAAGGGGGFFNRAWDFMNGKSGQILGAAGKAFGSAADTAAHNRGVQFDADIAKAQLEQQAERDYNDQMLKREQEGRAKQKNAWEMMNRAAYVQDAPANLNTTNLSPYSREIKGPNEGQRAGATSMFEQMSQHLKEGNTMEAPRRVGTDVQVQQPGFFEKWGGVIAPGLDAVSGLWNPNAPQLQPDGTYAPARPQIERRR